jgi:murein DD-endopeptidase MepM/ murein hydrolase activator NlpD
MPAIVEFSRSCTWPRWAALVLIAVSAAACSADTSRFSDQPFANPYASKSAPASNEVTGSINSNRVQSQALPPPPGGHMASTPLPPPPSRPATVASNVGGGVAGGGRGMASYNPAQPPADITGSVPAPRLVAPAPAPVRAWDWDGGTAVTVGQGDTLETLSRRYGVPASAIMQANAIVSPTGIRPGQRLVIPRYNTTSVAMSGAPQPQAPAMIPPRAAPPSVMKTAEAGTHVVVPGDNLTKIAHRYHVPLMELARANRIEPYAQIKMGDRLIIPGRSAAVAPSAAPRPVAQAAAQPNPLPAPAQKMASVESPHTARVITPATEKVEPEVTTQTADANNPAFRWPVRGRIIAGFGPKTNGQQNDGINLAVPEGTPIKAAEDGVVAYAGNELKGYGNLVLIRHPNGFVTAYAHASELMVKRGDQIKRGQVIARSGQTGTVTSPQLHFEIRKGSAPVDPTQYLAGA